ncbi:hypothetical protein LHFGNBLO_005965 (plasmid) [Mesorhizobium sp. AR10]|uniref:Orn/Lys/Arg family decarboxylase n=1 Tax=Mesorhizobium sp. AR10 TaxID=2865839 RepID=UPI00215DF71C|nr:hypothetical protein [Mesorhizobium sp. AR10]UVK35769.1 hypothetical protein LHFGNBLO_005965 [Mesorhizobium sp. AR10]
MSSEFAEFRHLAEAVRPLCVTLGMIGPSRLETDRLQQPNLRDVAGGIASIFEALDFSASCPSLDNAQGRGTGPCADLAAFAASLYGAPFARIGIAGSSGSNVTSALALRHLLGRPAKVLIDRSAHVSVIGGHAIAGSEVAWLQRRFDVTIGVQAPLSHQDVAIGLEANPDTDAVIITSPIYDGSLAADFDSLRRISDARGVLLIVDAAWGFFHGLLHKCGFPPSAAGLADATIISPHKKGCGLSQVSLTLFQNRNLMAAYDAVSDMGLASTSPAYYALLPLEVSLNFWASNQGQECGRAMVETAEAFGTAMARLPGIGRIRATDLGQHYIDDPCHVLLSTRGTGLSGYDILSALGSRFDVDAEMATLTSVLFLFGPEHLETWRYTVDAMEEVLLTTPRRGSVPDFAPPDEPAKQLLPLHAAMFGPKRPVPLDHAIGRISAQQIGAYPPGAAIIVPGEIISRKAVEYLCTVQAAGSRLKGVDGRLEEIGLIVSDIGMEKALVHGSFIGVGLGKR